MAASPMNWRSCLLKMTVTRQISHRVGLDQALLQIPSGPGLVLGGQQFRTAPESLLMIYGLQSIAL